MRTSPILLIASAGLATLACASQSTPPAAGSPMATTAASGQYPTTPPPPMDMRPLQLPPFQEFTLDNGLQVVLVQNAKLPVVIASLSMVAGVIINVASM